MGLDLDEEGYQVLANKIIVDEVESEDHQIALAEVMQVADDASRAVVLDVTPEKEDFGAWRPLPPSRCWLRSCRTSNAA